MREYQTILKREQTLREVYGINFLELKVLVEISGQYEWHDYKVLRRNTGLKDKNGKEIYEGDIVNEFRTSRSFPEGRNLKRQIKWNDDMTLDDSYGETAVGFNLFGGVLEVIGNIYENPN